MSYTCYNTVMAKKHKKRNKPYRGEDAKITGVDGQNKPVIHHYQAVARNPLNQWLYDKRRLIKPISIGVAVVSFLFLVIYGIIQTLGR